MVHAAEKEYKLLQDRYKELSEWIRSNTNHPDWMKKVSERNDVSVQMEVKRQQKNGNCEIPYTPTEIVYTHPHR